MLKVESQFTMIQRRGHRNLNQRFEIVKTLGQGTYGKVKLAIEKKTGRQFAIKSIRKKKITMKQDLGRIRREIEIMSTLGHPHIISVYEVFENPEKIILVMEYASGGELYDYINRKNGLSTSEARRFFRQIVSAVHYLHMHNIVHRDLKLENIVLDSDGNVKIADFGLSNIYADDHMLNTFCGSPLYASPEIVNGQPYCGPEVDCWSLGVLLYTFVYGAMPFDGSEFQRLRQQITDGNYMEPRKPSDATGLIRHLLTPDPKKRATIEAICRHWWINLGYDCTPIEQYPPIKLIDVTRLGENISLAHSQRNSSSDSDDEVDDAPPIQTALPVKGILKKTKSVSTDDEGEATVSKSITSLGGSTDVFDDSSVGIQKTSSPIDVVIPDLNRKPRRGILKNRKPSYSDSGCGLDDTELLLVTPSGGFECPSKDSGNSYDLSDIEAVLGEYDDVKDSTESAHSDCAHTESVYIDGVHTDTSCLSSTERTVNGFDKRTSAGESRSYDRLNDGSDLPHFNSALSISSFAYGGIVSSTPMQPVKGILKRRRKVSTERDPTWRYSLGSQGSNSSGDILDFSYDSTDADTYLSDILTTVAETKAQMFDNGCLETATDDDDYGPPPPLPRTAPPQHRHSGIYVDDDDADNIPVMQNGTDLEDIMSRLHVGSTSKMQPCTVESVDFFDLAEARQLCQQALTIGSNWG